MFSSRRLLFFSCLLVLFALIRAAPVVSPDDLVRRIAEPQGGMGGSGKDWKREPQNGMGGSSKDWKREAAPVPQGGFGGFGKDWKREPKPQGGFGGFGKDW